MRRLAICSTVLPILLWSVLAAGQTWRVVGERVPDSTVYDLAGNAVRLSTLWGEKPVLLVTGSLSCPPSRRTLPATAMLLNDYKGLLSVAIVYVIDAHPSGDPSPYSGEERVTRKNVKQGILIRQPRSQEERISRAVELQELLGSTAPILVDNMENTAWQSVGERPNAAVLIDKGGRVLAQQKWFDDASIRDMIERHIGTEH
ncbi:MAG: redoxin domain-containing protein [Gammaproteobacteria bacterium]|nr:redoxin domain-containing protein [Gammaproteobacteria bacterium]MDH4315108.1 redoxin domain-containing protein [Gammaproteobacteria bacterium]